jgi:hypothetical protein
VSLIKAQRRDEQFSRTDALCDDASRLTYPFPDVASVPRTRRHLHMESIDSIQSRPLKWRKKIQGSYVHAKRQGTCTAQRFIECDPVNILYATSGLLVRYESVELSLGLCSSISYLDQGVFYFLELTVL